MLTWDPSSRNPRAWATRRDAWGRAAGSAFTALVNSFFVSLIALIPGTRLGYTATIMALISLWSTLRLHRHVPRHDAALLQFALAMVAYLGQLVVGVASIFSPGTSGYVEALAYLLIASFAVALRRAWSLAQGRHLPAEQDIQVSD